MLRKPRKLDKGLQGEYTNFEPVPAVATIELNAQILELRCAQHKDEERMVSGDSSFVCVPCSCDLVQWCIMPPRQAAQRQLQRDNRGPLTDKRIWIESQMLPFGVASGCVPSARKVEVHIGYKARQRSYQCRTKSGSTFTWSTRCIKRILRAGGQSALAALPRAAAAVAPPIDETCSDSDSEHQDPDSASNGGT